MKRIILNLLPAIFLWLGICCIATAQDPGVAQSDQITDGQQIIQDDSSTTGKFQPVTVDPSATSDVALQFPLTLANKPVAVEPLDGDREFNHRSEWDALLFISSHRPTWSLPGYRNRPQRRRGFPSNRGNGAVRGAQPSRVGGITP